MKLPFPVSLGIVVVVSAAIGWALSQAGPAHPIGGGVPPRRAAEAPAALPQGWSYVAVARGRQLAVYRSPRGKHLRPAEFLTDKLSAGAPLTLLVKYAHLRWIHVYLPTRPNGAMGWVKPSSVKLLTTRYSLVVHLRSHELSVLTAGGVLQIFAIGVGRAVTPTPTGVYFITELLKQPNPRGLYGPYAFGISAYSGVLQHFGRGGNGQVGIHGTNHPELVGTNVSHGCIRLRNPDIIWLTKLLPLGTPVTIARD